ncbi:hypothetical protein [Azotobacter salinestris]|uniref:hypothetical protein n=1 Tax=Azotobacter salinestris TaxID=69964 RepID=UPI0032E01151
MTAYSARQMAGNGKGALEICQRHQPAKGKRQTFKRALQRFADLVIAPEQTRHSRPGQNLAAQRVAAAQEVIRSAVMRGRLGYANDLAEMAKSAPRELPFRFTHLDAWRIAVDQLHSLRAERRERAV